MIEKLYHKNLIMVPEDEKRDIYHHLIILDEVDVPVPLLLRFFLLEYNP